MVTKDNAVILIPAYNESEVIGDVLRKLKKSLAKKGIEPKIIVVNDGSSDNTSEIVGEINGVLLINHILNSGAGAATRTGLHYARDNKIEYVVTMDADGQHDCNDALKVLDKVSGDSFDLVIGSRLVSSKGMPWYRKLGNYGLSLFTFLLFGSTVRDSQSGLRGYGPKALSVIDFHSNNFTFNSELMWRAKQKNLKICEIPIKAIYSDYSLAKGQSNWNVIHIFRQLIKRKFLEFFNG